MIRLVLVTLFITGLNLGCAQELDFSTYEADWEGAIDADALSFEVTLAEAEGNSWKVTMANSTPFYQKTIASKTPSRIELDLGGGLIFKGHLDSDRKLISGFMKSGMRLYHLDLKHTAAGNYSGRWNPFVIDELKPGKMCLFLGEIEGESYVAYPIFPDNRYRGTFAHNFQKERNELTFQDLAAGFHFRGILKKDEIQMEIKMGNEVATTVNLKKSTSEWDLGTTAKSEQRNNITGATREDGWETELLDASTYKSLQRLSDSIDQNNLTYVHSVLIAKKGKMVFEKYYSGFHANLTHDQRSAAKSIGSAIIGIAQEDGYVKNVDQSIYDFIPATYQYTKDEQKQKISLKHLLTMSSGMDAIDFGTDRTGKATEDYYQNTEDWIKTILEEPLLFEPGEHCNYGSANPFLLGVGLAEVIDQPLEDYMHKKLLGPLGISNYSIFLDPDSDPYFGGGMYLTPVDMLKFGELYRNKGKWKGKQIISEQWIEDSFKKHHVLENTNKKNAYGYLWWHDTYEVGTKKIEAIEARGAGGQYISVIPELDLVIVITSGNYRNGRFWQPEMIIKDYILPALAE